MKERREQTMAEILEYMELDYAVRERFKMERHPEETVDGDNPWERDLFREEYE